MGRVINWNIFCNFAVKIKEMTESRPIPLWQGLLALSPLVVFLCLYLVTSIAIGDFYKMPISVAFVASSIYAVLITRGMKLTQRIESFSAGAANPNILQMIWIFVLAGAFAASASDIGCIDATVNLCLRLLPSNLVPAGLFIAACFISLAVGTSVGTIVALVPVAAGIADATGASGPFMVAIIVGGAFFGDNLSFISDTTIAATRSQGCQMLDKFRANARVVFPAAIIVLGIYLLCGFEGDQAMIEIGEVNYVKILPYLVVLGCALCGINVAAVLVLGILSVGIVGWATGSEDVFQWVGSMGQGIAGMGDLIIVTLLAGGMLELIRVNGGIAWILQALTARIHGRTGAGFSIAALVSLANLCTANNTIAIITVGPIAADIAQRFGVPAKKSASILDTFSCVVQGVIPYGAQLLMASSLSALSPIAIIANLYYPMVLLVCAILGIAIARKI